MRRLYRLDVTESGEKAIVFVIADGVDGVIQAIHDHDTGDYDPESLEAYIDGDKRPKAVTDLGRVPEELHDFVPWGDNDDEETVAEFLGDDGGEDDDAGSDEE